MTSCCDLPRLYVHHAMLTFAHYRTTFVLIEDKNNDQYYSVGKKKDRDEGKGSILIM